MGVLLWSYIIGLAISVIAGDFNYFRNIAFAGSVISILPCILGMFRIIGIKKRRCTVEREKNMLTCDK